MPSDRQEQLVLGVRQPERARPLGAPLIEAAQLCTEGEQASVIGVRQLHHTHHRRPPQQSISSGHDTGASDTTGDLTGPARSGGNTGDLRCTVPAPRAAPVHAHREVGGVSCGTRCIAVVQTNPRQHCHPRSASAPSARRPSHAPLKDGGWSTSFGRTRGSGCMAQTTPRKVPASGHREKERRPRTGRWTPLAMPREPFPRPDEYGDLWSMPCRAMP